MRRLHTAILYLINSSFVDEWPLGAALGETVLHLDLLDCFLIRGDELVVDAFLH